MVRPLKNKIVSKEPEFTCFKPAWIPRSKIEKVKLFAEELEAIRYLNLENLSQEQASSKMWISPSTLNRLAKSAYKKITLALVYWKWIQIYKTDKTWDCK